MSDQLKPCPFCGSNDIEVKQNFELDGMTFLMCDPYGAVVSFCGSELKNQAINAWNNRNE